MAVAPASLAGAGDTASLTYARADVQSLRAFAFSGLTSNEMVPAAGAKEESGIGETPQTARPPGQMTL